MRIEEEISSLKKNLTSCERLDQPQRHSMIYINPKVSVKDFHPSKSKLKFLKSLVFPTLKGIEDQDQQSGGLLDPMDKVEIAEEFDDEPQIEDVNEDEESLSKLYKDFRESFISREGSRRPSFL